MRTVYVRAVFFCTLLFAFLNALGASPSRSFGAARRSLGGGGPPPRTASARLLAPPTTGDSLLGARPVSCLLTPDS